MDKNRMRYAFVIVPVLMGLVVFVVLFLAGTKSDKEQMEKNAEETLRLAEKKCIQYERRRLEQKTKSLLSLTRWVESCARYVETGQNRKKSIQYIKEAGVTGLLLLDEKGNLLWQSELDGDTKFASVLSKECVQEILSRPKKTYMDRISLEKTDYDYGVVGREQGGLALGYKKTDEQTEEQKRYLKELLEDYPLKMDAIVVITDGETLISSNEKQYKTIKEDEGWYRRKGAYKQYDLYVFFPKEGVFRERNNTILGCMAVYGVLCLFLVFMRFHKRNGRAEKTVD